MNFNSLELLLLGLFAALGNVLGGLILFPSGIYAKFKPLLNYLLALGAGFMLAVIFIEILPKTVSLWQSKDASSGGEALIVPMILILCGYLLTQFFEHTIAPHFHLGEEVHSDHIIASKTVYTAIGGLMIHTFFDGVSIAAASVVDYKAGLLVFIAVFLHKFPEGFTIASMILAAGKNYRQVLLATGLVGLTTFLGVFLFLSIGQNLGITVAYALPLASGVTLYVAASDLIPEVNHHGGKHPLVSLAVFVGVALFFAVHSVIHLAMEN